MQPDGLLHWGSSGLYAATNEFRCAGAVCRARLLSPLGFLRPLMLPLMGLGVQELYAARWLVPLRFPAAFEAATDEFRCAGAVRSQMACSIGVPAALDAATGEFMFAGAVCS